MDIEKAREMLAAATAERPCDCCHISCRLCENWWEARRAARAEIGRLGFTPATLAVLILAVEALERLQKLVSEQAEDEGLWHIAEDVPTAYVQRGLRRLHSEIESCDALAAWRVL